MPILNLSFDTGNVAIARITDALAMANGYQATVGGQPNPQTKAQFARNCVKNYITRTVRDYEREAARKTAEASVTDVALT